MDDEVIDISSGEEEQEHQSLSRRDIFAPFIQSAVSALGSSVQPTSKDGRIYDMGDSCLGCLRDLKKFWRKDDTDDERTVARIFWETRVLPNDLVPILLETAGKGAVEDRCALACADLITAMTWPIDLAEELQELDDEEDAGTDYSTLLHAQLTYKAALLRPGVLQALLAIAAPPLAKSKRDRTERDGQIINVVLHAFRNLAFIKDRPATSDQTELSSLQSKMITIMQQTQILDLLLTLASNVDDNAFNAYNAVLLEILTLLYRGVKPIDLVRSQQTGKRMGTGTGLQTLLEQEAKRRREEIRSSASRHSRFGTTVAIKSGKDTYILHKQRGLTADPSSIMDANKKRAPRKVKRQDELASFEQLNAPACTALYQTAVGFMDNCFGVFCASLLKDIKAERHKMTERDNIRLLILVKWFVEFFLACRMDEVTKLGDSASSDVKWTFDMVGEIVDRSWIGWALKRMRIAMDDKPKQWTELRAGMECLTQVLYLLEQMSLPSSPDVAHEASKTLQHQLYYSGEILEIAFESLRSYKEQSIAYLDSSVHLAHQLLRMLERWATTQGEMYVRKRKKPKKTKAAKSTEEDGVVDVPSEDEEEEPHVVEEAANEHMFTFAKFESQFAQEGITRACLAYLSRYQDFDSSEQMKRVVGLLHRQAVKAQAEGLFFQVTTLDLFNEIIARQKTLPHDEPYKNLQKLIQFVLRKFFKAVEEQPMLIVEAFFPMNRGHWKQYSSFEPEMRELDKPAKATKPAKLAADVEVSGAWTEEEQIAIAVACLVETEKTDLVDWVRTTLMMVIGLRQSIVSEVDGDDGPSTKTAESGSAELPSAEAMRKFEDYSIPYAKEEYAEAATKNPHLRLLLRLIKCYVVNADAEELEWYFPAAILPNHLQFYLDTITKYLRDPLDLEGKKATDHLRKKRARHAPHRAQATSQDYVNGKEDEPRKRKARRTKEEAQYKSAEFIEDSDAELGNDEEFFLKEEEIRVRAAAAAASGGTSLMNATGTKKRKRGDKATSVGADSNQGGREDEDKPRKKRTQPKERAPRKARKASRGKDEEPGQASSPPPEPVVERPRPKPIRKRRPNDTPSSPTTASSAHLSSPGLQAIEDLALSSYTGSDDAEPISRISPLPFQTKEPAQKADDEDEEIVLSYPRKRRVVIVSDEDE